MVDQFWHIGVSVFDLKKSVQFFTEVLGCEVEYESHHKGDRISQVVGVDDCELDIVVVKRDGVKFELIDYKHEDKKKVGYPDQDAPGLVHICFRVDDVDSAYQKFRELGYEGNSTPMVTRENGPKICYMRGPDNIIMELYEVRN